MCVALFSFCITPINGQTSDKIFKVVIDAGHGDHDPGCIGTLLKEKDVNLDVALKLGKLISENCPDVQVIYTRKTDVFVELYRRAQIANSNHADLFISIHCNASESPQGNGVETFVMGLAKSEANQAVARKENAAMLMEKNYQNNYDGFNPSSPESNVIFSLYSSAYLNQSIILASKVQHNLLSTSHLNDRGVKQAGYWVLYKVAMPSILVELGFLSNPSDQAYLAKQANIQREAAAIYNAFVDYLSTVNGSSHKHLTITPLPPENEPTGKTQETANHDASTGKASVSTQKEEVVNNIAPAESTLDKSKDEVRFRVQFFASPEQLATNDARLKGLPDVKSFHENNWWKYTAGIEASHERIVQILAEVKKKYPDAFIVAFMGEQKISEKEGLRLLKK